MAYINSGEPGAPFHVKIPYEVKIEHIFFYYADTTTYADPVPKHTPMRVEITYTYYVGGNEESNCFSGNLTLYDMDKIMNMSPNTMILLIRSRMKELMADVGKEKNHEEHA